MSWPGTHQGQSTALDEALSAPESRALRRGDTLSVMTRRAAVKVQKGRDPFTIEPFKGPRVIEAEYVRDNAIPFARWRGKGTSAYEVRWRGQSILVPRADAQERRSSSRQALVADVNRTQESLSGSRTPVMGRRDSRSPLSPLGGYRIPSTDRMSASRKKKRRSGREQPFIDPEDFSFTEIVTPQTSLGKHPVGLALTTQPVGSLHGVGVSPSAASRDRHSNYLDYNGLIKKRKRGKKQHGLGTHLGTVATVQRVRTRG